MEHILKKSISISAPDCLFRSALRAPTHFAKAIFQNRLALKDPLPPPSNAFDMDTFHVFQCEIDEWIQKMMCLRLKSQALGKYDVVNYSRVPNKRTPHLLETSKKIDL